MKEEIDSLLNNPNGFIDTFEKLSHEQNILAQKMHVIKVLNFYNVVKQYIEEGRFFEEKIIALNISISNLKIGCDFVYEKTRRGTKSTNKIHSMYQGLNSQLSFLNNVHKDFIDSNFYAKNQKMITVNENCLSTVLETLLSKELLATFLKNKMELVLEDKHIKTRKIKL